MSDPVIYTADQPNGRPASDAEIRDVLPPELYETWKQLDENEDD